jgi:aspartyl-tRNA(Asn)/glutamyl-tRNA(Gln) amidotransferase subunit A
LPLSSGTAKAFDDALSIFNHLGADIRPVALPKLRDFNNAKNMIALSEQLTIHPQDLCTRPALFGASLRYRTIAGGLVRAEEYILAMRAHRPGARHATVMATVDVLMLPTRKPAGKLQLEAPETLFTKTSFTTPFNVGGNPAFAICNGFSEAGLPFPQQIVGRLFDDATVLRVGDAFERVTPWREKGPALQAAS